MNEKKIKAIYQQFIEIGRQTSLEECSGGYLDHEDCAWYHGNWMLLRYLGVVSNPFWHESFYYNALKFANAKEKYLLVAGTADFSMPLLCSEFGISRIDICDLCKTPLIICDKVSNVLGFDWKTYAQDICYTLPQKYDIIINDAFLSRFDDKTAALNGISAGLTSKGYYITTLKCGKRNVGGDIPFDVRKAFSERVREKYIRESSYIPNYDIDAISSTYADKISSFPVDSEDEVHVLFEKAGLVIRHLEKGDVEGEFEASTYFRIISQKH